MKLAIVNQPLANRGDEAAHKAFVRELAKAFPESLLPEVALFENCPENFVPMNLSPVANPNSSTNSFIAHMPPCVRSASSGSDKEAQDVKNKATAMAIMVFFMISPLPYINRSFSRLYNTGKQAKKGSIP